MASNAKITQDIKKLDPSASTEGLTNAELKALLSKLKAAPAPAPEAAPAAAAAAETPAPAPETEVVKKAGFHVMAGKAITSKRGILADGDEIKAEDLAGGKEALEAFVKSGHVGKA